MPSQPPLCRSTIPNRSVFVSHHRPPGCCTSGARAPHSSTTCSLAKPAVCSCCGSRIPMSRAIASRAKRRYTTIFAGSECAGMKAPISADRMGRIVSPSAPRFTPNKRSDCSRAARPTSASAHQKNSKPIVTSRRRVESRRRATPGVAAISPMGSGWSSNPPDARTRSTLPSTPARRSSRI
jgi:hypothetical protein